MAFAKAIKEFGRQDLNKLRSGEVASPPLFSLSIRTAAKLLNINERTMIKVLKTLQVLKIIKIYPQKPVKISHEKMDISFVSDYPGYRFITDKGTYQQFGQRLELIQYPVLIPKMTYKQYLKFYKSD